MFRTLEDVALPEPQDCPSQRAERSRNFLIPLDRPSDLGKPPIGAWRAERRPERHGVSEE